MVRRGSAVRTSSVAGTAAVVSARGGMRKISGVWRRRSAGAGGHVGTCVSIIRSAIFSSIGLEANAFTLATSASSRSTMVVIKQRMRVDFFFLWIADLKRCAEQLEGHTG